MTLREWQKDWIRDVFSPSRPDGRRLIRQAIFSMPKKNGKTGLMAPLLLAFLVGPCAEPNGEIYSAANDRAQASIIFDAVKALVEANPVLAGIITVVPSTKTMFVHRSDLRCRGSRFKALSADAKTKQGYKPSLVVYDELGEALDNRLLTALRYGFGARSEPLLAVISTQAADPQHPLSLLIDDGLTGNDPTTVCHLYAAPDDADILDQEIWFQCNPALGDFRDLDDFDAQASRAARLPAEEQGFRLYLYNQRVSGIASLIPASEWRPLADEFEIEPRSEVGLALDMSGRFDLTALTMVTIGDGLIRTSTRFWKPADLLADHARRDGFDYVVQAQRGYLLTSPGKSIDPMVVALAVAETVKTHQVKWLVYDRWKIDEFMRCLDVVGLEAQVGPGDGLRVEPWGQGYRDMSPAVDALQAAVLDDRLRHDDNPVMNFCVTNAVVTQDAAGLRKLDKDKSRFRIDGAVTLAMGLAMLARDRAKEDAPSPFEDPDFVYFFG